jgi:hypothetical protein
MDAFHAIETRFKFRVPQLYRDLHAAGHFSSGSDAYIELTDHRWMSVEDIASHEFQPWQTITQTFFVPFSSSARRDEWGWRLDWTESGEPAVVFCERGPEGKGFGRDFRAFLYRMVLEELSGTWLLAHTNDEMGKARIAKTINAILPHMPPAWKRRIEELSGRPWIMKEKEGIFVFPRSECDRIYGEDAPFSHLNEVFMQELD